MEFSKEELWKLYEIEIKRENEIRTRWRNSFNVYITMLLSFISAIILIANFASNYDNICFIGGGILVVFLSIIAFLHFKLDYKYQMELLSIQAKIEDLLGLTDPNKVKLPLRWENEALLPKWYYANKNEKSSTENFINTLCSIKRINGYSFVYLVFVLVGISLIVLGIVL